MKIGLAVERGAGKSRKHYVSQWFWRVPSPNMDLGTRQNHGGLRFSEFAPAFDQSVINISILGSKIEAWHKLIPNTDFKVQAQAYANSL